MIYLIIFKAVRREVFSNKQKSNYFVATKVFFVEDHRTGLRMRGIFKSVRVRVFQQLAHRVTHRIQHFWLPTRSHFAFSSLPTLLSRVLRDSAPRYVGWSVGWSVAFLGSGPEGPLACRT